MKNANIGILLLLFMLASLSACHTIPIRRYTGNPKKVFPIPANPVEKDGWELTFQDEFDDGKLNRQKWQTKLSWGWSNEHHGRYNPGDNKQYFADDMFEFTDSTILLKADTTTLEVEGLKFKHVCGLIDCGKYFEQQYGYFEIRSKNPNSPGYWPAFWMISNKVYPPEVDVYEFYTSRPKRWTHTLHYKDEETGEKGMTHSANRVPDASEDFHIYAVEWNAQEIKWYYNNYLIRTTPVDDLVVDVPMYIIINIAMEDASRKQTKMEKAIFPNYLEVDYVRVYKKIIPN